MHKLLQALLDTILLSAGAIELGSAPYSPTNRKQDAARQTASKPAFTRDLPIEPALRPDPQAAPAGHKHHAAG